MVAELLRACLAIVRAKGWNPIGIFRDEEGVAITLALEQSRQRLEMDKSFEDRALWAIEACIPFGGFWAWETVPERSQAEVVALLEKTMRRCEKMGEAWLDQDPLDLELECYRLTQEAAKTDEQGAFAIYAAAVCQSVLGNPTTWHQAINKLQDLLSQEAA